jgi:hypothetical protein
MYKVSPPAELLLYVNGIEGMEPHIEWQLSKGSAIVCDAVMQDREKEGCWYITIGYVFNQEPSESGP